MPINISRTVNRNRGEEQTNGMLYMQLNREVLGYEASHKISRFTNRLRSPMTFLQYQRFDTLLQSFRDGRGFPKFCYSDWDHCAASRLLQLFPDHWRDGSGYPPKFLDSLKQKVRDNYNQAVDTGWGELNVEVQITDFAASAAVFFGLHVQESIDLFLIQWQFDDIDERQWLFRADDVQRNYAASLGVIPLKPWTSLVPEVRPTTVRRRLSDLIGCP